jgi:thioredoxin 1
MIQFTDENFADYFNSTQPVVVDFSAEWCGPCKAIAPLLEAIAEEYDGRAIVGTVDVDESPETAARFGVRNIPTIVYLKDGKLVDKQVGAVPKKTLTDKLDAIL